ncbi:hypothetical protein P9A16_32550 [Shinella sp. 838]|uniref:hypothetical protein n=1 Tax=Shinella sp. 838 TaxID=3038164 RepID=UPI00241581E6|nr:hypothetical protein [Shinella sp. 838]MDG4675833.1 hypothetical protein [Shinella sp. 838]
MINAKMATFIIALVLGVAATSNPATADLGAEDAEVFRLSYAFTNGRAVDVAFRKELADALYGFWRKFDSSVPRNSPSETEWLLKELDTRDADRLGRAAITPQYALRELATLSEQCLADASLLQSSVGKRPLLEMYAWLRIVGCYNNPAGTEEYLKRAKLSKGLFDGPLTMGHATILHSFITGRLANTIIEEE